MFFCRTGMRAALHGQEARGFVMRKMRKAFFQERCGHTMSMDAVERRTHSSPYT